MIVPAQLCGLVVEDNDYSRNLTAECLNKLGIGTVLQAADGTEGLQLLHSQKVDFAVLDWYMPEINGAGFIRLVRGGQMNCPANLPIIISTAYATRENITRMRELQCHEILIKPFDSKQLSGAISIALSKSRSAAIEIVEADEEDDLGQILL